MKEWRDIPSLPGCKASSDGTVRQDPFWGSMPNGGRRSYGGKECTGSWDGERYIFAFRGKTYKVARLVCEAFHGPAPFLRAVAMHMDENSSNNNPGNLAWGTQKDNLNAPGFIRYCKGRTGENSPFLKGRKLASELRPQP